MTSTKLGWLLLRAAGLKGAIGSILLMAGVALVSALLLFSVTGNFAFEARGERTAWRTAEHSENPTAIQATTTHYAAGQPITQIDLEKTGDKPAPTPPGIPHFPAPGEVWVSPALKKLINELPNTQLADRYPSSVTGLIGETALTHPNELVAIIGHSTGTLELDKNVILDNESPTPIDSFDGVGAEEKYFVYQVLMAVATVLMVIPLLIFGGAAARLSVTRRDERLATLRLVGATPGQVVTMTVTETLITATIGSLIGAGLYIAMIPALAHIKIDNGPWYLTDLFPDWTILIATMLTVPVLVGISALTGLRRVIVSPLGVKQRVTPPRVKVYRLLVLVVSAITFGYLANDLNDTDLVGFIVLLLVIAGVFLGIHIAGPWVVWLLGAFTTTVAKRPSMLLAGRRLRDDPKASWRMVGGIALIGFVAGFNMMVAGEVGQTNHEETTMVEIAVSSAEETDFRHALKRQLPETAHVLPAENTDLQDEPNSIAYILVSSPTDNATLDTVRTVVSSLSPMSSVMIENDGITSSNILDNDVMTGMIVVLVVSFIIAAASAGISSASSVLDRRRVYALLHLAGTPLQVLNKARRNETLIPLLIMGVGSIVTGAMVAAPLISTIKPSINVLLITVVIGFASVMGASALSRPLLRNVVHNASPQPD